MADSRLAQLKEAARRKKEKGGEKEAPKAAPKKEAEPPKAVPKSAEAPKPSPKKEGSEPARLPPQKKAELPKKELPKPEPKARKAEPAGDVDSEVDAAFAETEPASAPKKQAPKKEVPKGPGPPSFEIDTSKIRRDPSPGRYGKLIDLIRENEKLQATQDVYAVLFACIKRYSEVEGKSKGIKDLVDEETKKYLESRKAAPA